MTEKTYAYTCSACGQPFVVTAGECAAHGWTEMFQVEHIGCAAPKSAPQAETDWTTASDEQVMRHVRSILGDEN